MNRQKHIRFGLGVAAKMICGGLVVLLVVFSAAKASADRSFRCDGKLVTIGATTREVLEVCGEPDHIKHWEVARNHYVSQLFDYESERYLAPKLLMGPIRMARWTYDLGSHRFIRYLDFQNGTLIRIKTGDKGGR